MLQIFLLILSLNILYSSQNFPFSIIRNLLDLKTISNPSDLYLREWLNKLIIDLPNDLIKNETKGYIENLTIYNISLESLLTTRKKYIDNKIGLEITLRNASFNIKGKYIFLSDEAKNFLAKVSSLTVKLPFYLVRNESGFVTEVDTSGFNIDIDNAKIELDLDTSEVIRKIIVGILKAILQLIKKDIVEKNIIKTLNEKIMELFNFVNNIILSKVEPEELNILINESDRANLKNSPILGSVAYVLSNLTGANGRLSINDLVNIFTNDTGFIRLKNFYDKEIHFELNFTDKSNISLGNLEFYLNDLNVTGLNSWSEFSSLQPIDPLQLFTHTNLDNLTINVSFSIRIKFNNNSKLVKEDSILYEEAQFRIYLKNNKMNALLQLPFNDKRAKEYTSQECLNMDCVMNLIDSNGTGITALSLNETFSNILLEIKGGSYLYLVSMIK